MRIIKLKGRTEEAIKRKIEKEYGERAVILKIDKEESEGAFKWLKASQIVMTLAVKEEIEQRETQAEKVTAIPVQNPKSEASYDVLIQLQQEIKRLHEEIGEIKENGKKNSQLEGMSALSIPKENTLSLYMCHKLQALGIAPGICQELCQEISGSNSEEVIRQLFTKLEKLIEEKKESQLPQVVFFMGSTGVGKTTTIAKLTAKYVLEEEKKVVLFTSDTYRIAAVEQLRTYAEILGVEIEIIYDEKELPKYLEKWKHVDHILIDTAGRSHKNKEQVTELKALMAQVPDKQVFLVLNASTQEKDVKKMMSVYEEIATDFDLIITKLDETDEEGNLINISHDVAKPIAYVTDGQNVPADIKAFDKQTYIAALLGRLNDE